MENKSKRVSCLICFAGANRRVEINPRLCFFKGTDYSYKTLYKAEDGTKYPIEIKSVAGTQGAFVNVKVYSAKGIVIAERERVPVRFYKYLYN